MTGRDDTMIFLPCDGDTPAGEGFTQTADGAALLRRAADALGGDDLPAPHVLANRIRLARAMMNPAADEAMLAPWRGALATALLYDCWALPADAPSMTVEAAGESPFEKAVNAALPQGHEPLRLMLLGGVPLGLLGGDMGITPAADPTGLGERLPARVTWYDRAREEFLDPCMHLNESDRRILMRRLSMMADCPAVAAFRKAILAAQAQQAAEAATTLALRAKAVCGFAGTDALTTLRETYLPDDPANNPILAGTGGSACPAAAAQTTYLWQGQPFARTCDALALESARAPGEWQALSALTAEIELMERYSASWRQSLTAGLVGMRAEDAAAAAILAELREAAAQSAEPAQVTVLSWPWEADSAAVRLLLKEALGEAAQSLAQGPFSDALTVMPSCPADALTDGVLQQVCWVRFAQPTEPCGALPPISPEAAKLLSGGLMLVPDSFRMMHERTETGEERTHATFAVQGKRTVVFTRVYGMDEICVLAPGEIPTVAVWPSAPFPQDRWRAYFVLAHQPSSVCVEALCGGEWQRGEYRQRGDVPWTIQQTADYPAYLTLHMDGRSIGALPNLLPPFDPIKKGSAVACVDFGVSGTAVVIRMGEEVVPMGGASMTRTLLHGANPPPIMDAVLAAPQVRAVLPTVLTVQGDGARPLLDGFICPPELAGDDALFDLKWLGGARREQAWRLYLGQVMLTASLTAVMRGAADITWRMAIPDGMAAEGRAALASCISALVEEWADATGLPLTAGKPPVSFATESLAAGTYFRMRSEVNLKGGLTTLDIGAGSVTMALWLRGQSRPSAVCTLPLGVHMMLTDSLLAEPGLITDCLTEAASPGLRTAAEGLQAHMTQARGSLRALQRARIAMEDCLLRHGQELQGLMNARAAQGACTRMEAQLLWRLAEVMLCGGLLLEQLYQNPTLNDLLPAVMPVAVSGRGALLLQGMDTQRQARLWRLMSLPMSRSHPVQELLPLVTPEPKLESASGLAQLSGLPEQPDAAEAYVSPGVPPTPPVMLLQRFIAAFRMEFPDATDVLLPGGFKLNGGFTPELDGLLSALAAQHFPQGMGMQAQYVACLNALAAAWVKPE